MSAARGIGLRMRRGRGRCVPRGTGRGGAHLWSTSVRGCDAGRLRFSPRRTPVPAPAALATPDGGWSRGCGPQHAHGPQPQVNDPWCPVGAARDGEGAALAGAKAQAPGEAQPPTSSDHRRAPPRPVPRERRLPPPSPATTGHPLAGRRNPLRRSPSAASTRVLTTSAAPGSLTSAMPLPPRVAFDPGVDGGAGARGVEVVGQCGEHLLHDRGGGGARVQRERAPPLGEGRRRRSRARRPPTPSRCGSGAAAGSGGSPSGRRRSGAGARRRPGCRGTSTSSRRRRRPSRSAT